MSDCQFAVVVHPYEDNPGQLTSMFTFAFVVPDAGDLWLELSQGSTTASVVPLNKELVRFIHSYHNSTMSPISPV